MRQVFFLAVVCAVVTVATFGFQAQNRPPQPAPAAPAAAAPTAPAADPYLNNAAPGTTQLTRVVGASSTASWRVRPPSAAFDPP